MLRSGRGRGGGRLALVLALILLAVAALWRPRTHGTNSAGVPAREAADPTSVPDPTQVRSVQAPAASTDDSARREASADPAESPAPRRARLRGELRDDATGEPLPAYAIGVYSFNERGAGKRRIETDAQGRFESGFELQSGRTTLELIDHEGLAFRNRTVLSREFDAGDSALVDARAESGPTVFFEVEFPADLGPADFDARLTPGLPFQGIPYPQPPLHATVRAAHAATARPDLPWVRFGERPGWNGLAYVELRSMEGRWCGGGWIETTRGVVAQPVGIVLRPATRLLARVVGDGERDANFRLVERLAHDSLQRPQQYAGSSDIDGELVIEFLEPGEYRLSTHDARWALFERDLTIAPGDNDIGELRLTARPVVGAIRGTIESRSGRYEGACHVSLSDTAFDHDALFDHSLDFEADASGRLVARIEIEDVTAGEWWLYVHCHDGFSHAQSRRRVIAPIDDLRIVLEDDSADVEIELSAAETGAALDEDSSVEWRCGEAFEVEDGPHVRIEGLPDAPATWRFLASAPGRVPQRADGLSLQRLPSPANGRARYKGSIGLRAGFGAWLVLRDRTRYSRVEGASVTVDGQFVGRSDARGELWIEGSRRPERIAVEKAGWRWVASSGCDPADGRLHGDGEIDIALERVP